MVAIGAGHFMVANGGWESFWCNSCVFQKPNGGPGTICSNLSAIKDIHDWQSRIVLEHFWARGFTPTVDSRRAKEKAAGAEQRQHGLVSMLLSVPTV